MGVGGQGVVLISELLGNAAVIDGLNVRGSEIRGMAVRGGSVVSTVRMGSEVYGPLTPMGKGDVIIGLEPAEVLRYSTYLSKSSVVILNTEPVIPFTVSLGQREYPGLDVILARLKMVSSRVAVLNATEIANEAGSPMAANMAMLGATFGTGRVPIKLETIKEAIRDRFPAKLAPVNIRVFDLGYQVCQKVLK